MKIWLHRDWICGLCLVLALAACAGGISQQARGLVTYRGPFADLQRRPDRHMGEVVHLGGRVIATTAGEQVTDITILHLFLDWNGRPVDDNRSAGRYLVRSREFIDPEIYKPGSLMSVVGRLMGSEFRPIGDHDYRYPVILPIEVRHWPRRDYAYPGFRIGIGVGGSF